jgi:protein O-GlcNAc transferase
MGVPVVTLPGETAASRAGAAIARNLRLPDVVATSSGDYVVRALSLASQVEQLSALRRNLRPKLRLSPLMDAARFGQQLGETYADAWQRWCGGEVLVNSRA